jgi:hypothetical protein
MLLRGADYVYVLQRITVIIASRYLTLLYMKLSYILQLSKNKQLINFFVT